MNAFLKLGGILFWAVAIGSEYAIQKWPQAKKFLNRLAMCSFALALCAEYGSYRYEEFPAIQWFQASDTNAQTFILPDIPVPGSEELLINGLIEPPDIYAVHGRAVTHPTEPNRSDHNQVPAPPLGCYLNNL